MSGGDGLPDPGHVGPPTANILPFVEVLKSIYFQGASGRVEFLGEEKVRSRESVTAGSYNIQRSNMTGQFEAVLTATRRIKQTGAMAMEWRLVETAVPIYANGLSTPPETTLFISEANYLEGWVQVFGFFLFGIACCLCLFFGLGVFLLREDRVVKAGQPFFLLLVCVGSIISCTSILTSSFDESTGWSNETLSWACTMTPWFFFLGLVTVYAALFSKMWRVDRLLQLKRQRVNVVQVIWPLIVLLIITTTLLSTWTAYDGIIWDRELVSLDPPESYGKCKSDHDNAFFGSLVAVKMMAAGLAIALALKTMDIPESLSDTKAVMYALLVHLQGWFVGLPVLASLGDDNVSTAYLGRVLLIFVFSISTPLCLIAPKFYQTRRQRKLKSEDGLGRTRSSRVFISGLDIGPSSGPVQAIDNDFALPARKADSCSRVTLEASFTYSGSSKSLDIASSKEACNPL